MVMFLVFDACTVARRGIWGAWGPGIGYRGDEKIRTENGGWGTVSGWVKSVGR